MILDIRDITKSYRQPEGGRLEVLKPVRLQLEQGETLAITGHSGSGKTTLLSLIAGLDSPDSGSILLEGKDLCTMGQKDLSRYRARKIGMIFQQFHLMPHLSARENISLPLEIARSGDIARKTDAMLDNVGLRDRQHHLPGQLSGGECQRVAIARALVITPALLLADEPTGNLDTDTGDIIADLLFDLVKHRNMTLIVVTHNQGLAARCSTVRHLERGVLI
ncbi:MAG: ABC transporter ATP-binding protein [Pseudomonadota bacterium]